MRSGWLATTLAISLGIVTQSACSREDDKLATGPANPGVPSGYSLEPSFSDEFDGDKLDTKTWINVFAPRKLRDPQVVKRTLLGNAERQVYFDPSYLGLGIDPFRVANGILTITAAPLAPAAQAMLDTEITRQREDFQKRGLHKLAYSSGLISTRGGFTQKYGYFEMRARWSAGKGLWPAFWLLPADGGWPPEIDILEAHGDKPGIAFQSTHSSFKPKAVTRKATIDGTGQEFHRYGALWLPDRVEYYIDGIRTETLPTPADMTQPMYILLNLAVGGAWPGYPDATVKFPATLDVDYIRAWRFTALPPQAKP